MRKPAAVILTSSLLAGTALFTLGVSSASATGTPTCASKVEFTAVTAGMSRDRVHEIFGIDGVQTMSRRNDGHLYTVRQYKPCLPASYVSVSYTDNKVTTKHAQWG